MQTDSRIQFSFGIAMATRYGEDDWLETLEGLTERNTGEVRKILLDYNVPLIDEQGNVLAAWRRQNR
ncbi:MAG: hypothetical protein GWO02_18685 [Gammaproteobacteria bacterium]|nr:hypothetical protein [Gammaproteobacteria bacterium]